MPDAPWQTAASKVKILILGQGQYDHYSDSELIKIADFMGKRGAKLGVGLDAITKIPSEGCGGMEGYGSPQMAEALAARLSRLNIRLGYVEADGPVWFGHYEPDAKACRLPIDQVARRTAPTLKGFLKYYPDAIYGDVEGSALTGQPDWQENFGTYRKLLEQEIGHRLDALNIDMAWPLPSWPDQLVQLAGYAHGNALRLGVVYNGDGFDRDDAAWIDHARRNFERVEGELGILPDHAVIASWNDHPERFLPETSPTAFSNLVLSYLRPRTRFELDRSAGAVAGRIVDEQGRGLAAAPVRLQRSGLPGNQPPPEQRISGTVPAQAKTAVFAFGINLRPDIAGDNDVLVGDFTYAEGEAGSAQQVISVPGKVARDRDAHPGGIENAAAVQIGDQRLARLVVDRHQSYHFNSPRFPVNGGAQFSLAGPIASLTAQGMFGAIDIVWFDAEDHDKWRSTLIVDRTLTTIAETVSDSEGRFKIVPPAGARLGGLRLVYPGSDKLRAAYADMSAP